MSMKTLCLCLLILSCSIAGAQTSAAPELPKKLIRTSCPRLAINDDDSSTVLLKMEFNGAIPVSRLASINVDRIESITLAYSRYKLSEMFDQLALNARRMDKLYAAMPGLKDNKNIQWYWAEQTGCEDPGSCEGYFHGFVIKLKSAEKEIVREGEIALMDYYTEVLEGHTDTRKIDSLIAVGKLKLVKKCDTVNIKSLLKGNRMARIRGWNMEVNEKLAKLLKQELEESEVIGLHLLISSKGALKEIENIEDFRKPARIKKLLDKHLTITPARYCRKRIETKLYVELTLTDGQLHMQLTQEPVLPEGHEFVLDKFLYSISQQVVCDYIDTSVKTGGPGGPVVHRMAGLFSTPDLVTKVFDRNKQWKNCLVVTDVTGSMYPYLAQFRAWHKLHMGVNSGNHDFIFFNDGDTKPDFLKHAGHVGGIYYVNTSEFDEMSQAMAKSMRKGGGGDCPENNIEAVLEGLEKNPHCKEVIMIADNWATPRDLSLLAKVKVPIRLVLCGTQYGGINTAYLDMVRENGGSIHTIEEDLYDLAKLMEGETIDLDGLTYQIKNGHFQLAPKS